MFAVICDPDADLPALWAADRLRARLGKVVLLHLDLLGVAPRFVLTVEDGAGMAAGLTLPDGSTLASAGLRGVLNRVTRPPRPTLAGPDAAYAAEELGAAALAWLAAFGRSIVNAPHPAAPGGHDPGPAAWLQLAAIAGLPAAPWRTEGLGLAPLPPATHRALVIGDAAFGLPAPLARSAVALAGLAGLDLMGLDLDAAGRVVGATALPDLRLGGEAGADALAALLAARG